jgi:hypothetical protein
MAAIVERQPGSQQADSAGAKGGPLAHGMNYLGCLVTQPFRFG